MFGRSSFIGIKFSLTLEKIYYCCEPQVKIMFEENVGICQPAIECTLQCTVVVQIINVLVLNQFFSRNVAQFQGSGL